jgi:hypothetical protein
MFAFLEVWILTKAFADNKYRCTTCDRLVDAVKR